MVEVPVVLGPELTFLSPLEPAIQLKSALAVQAVRLPQVAMAEVAYSVLLLQQAGAAAEAEALA